MLHHLLDLIEQATWTLRDVLEDGESVRKAEQRRDQLHLSMEPNLDHLAIFPRPQHVEAVRIMEDEAGVAGLGLIKTEKESLLTEFFANGLWEYYW